VKDVERVEMGRGGRTVVTCKMGGWKPTHCISPKWVNWLIDFFRYSMVGRETVRSASGGNENGNFAHPLFSALKFQWEVGRWRNFGDRREVRNGGCSPIWCGG